MTTATEAVSALFRSTFSREPHSFWSAPGRVNLIGEHTDYNDGFVLPAAINRTTTVAIAPRADRQVRVVSTLATSPSVTDLGEILGRRFRAWTNYPLGVAWALLDHDSEAETRLGFDIAIDSDVPIGAGLSSSAAIEIAVGLALSDQWSLALTQAELARIGQRAENIAVGAPTGIMDQFASVFGQRDAAVFLDCRSREVQHVALGFDADDLALLVVDTKVQHQHATGGYRDRRAACERGAAAMDVPALRDLSIGDLPRAQRLLDNITYRRVRHVVTENFRVLESVKALRAGDLVRFGELMDASHESMRDDFEISVPQLDSVVALSQSMGALGARMTGGGFGGSAIALVRAGDADAIAARTKRHFAAQRWGSPLCFTVRASDGARRITKP